MGLRLHEELSMAHLYFGENTLSGEGILHGGAENRGEASTGLTSVPKCRYITYLTRWTFAFLIPT